MYFWTNLTSIPTREREKMAGDAISFEGVLVDLSTPILPNIGGEPSREAQIELHILISENTESMASNLGGSRHGHLTRKIIEDKYIEQTG